MEMSRFWVSMILLNALVIIFIYYLGKMREAFVKINDGQTLELDSGDIFDNELGSALEILGSSTPVDSFMSADIGEKGLFLILVNVVVYACGAVAAFIRHDSHPDFEKVIKAHSRLRSVLSIFVNHMKIRFQQFRNPQRISMQQCRRIFLISGQNSTM